MDFSTLSAYDQQILAKLLRVPSVQRSILRSDTDRVLAENATISAAQASLVAGVESANGGGSTPFGERLELNGCYPLFRQAKPARDEFPEIGLQEEFVFVDPVVEGATVTFHVPILTSKVHMGSHDTSRVPEFTASPDPAAVTKALANDDTLHGKGYREICYDTFKDAATETVFKSKNVTRISGDVLQTLMGTYELQGIERGAFVDPGVAGMQVYVDQQSVTISKFSHPTERGPEYLIGCAHASSLNGTLFEMEGERVLLFSEVPSDTHNDVSTMGVKPTPMFRKSMTALTGAAALPYVRNRLAQDEHSEAQADAKYEGFLAALDNDHFASTRLDMKDRGDYHKGILSSTQTVHMIAFNFKNASTGQEELDATRCMYFAQRNVVDDAALRGPEFSVMTKLLEGSGLFIDRNPSFSQNGRTIEGKFDTILRDMPLKVFSKVEPTGTEAEKQATLLLNAKRVREYKEFTAAELAALAHAAAYHFLSANTSGTTEQQAFYAALALDHKTDFTRIQGTGWLEGAVDWPNTSSARARAYLPWDTGASQRVGGTTIKAGKEDERTEPLDISAINAAQFTPTWSMAVGKPMTTHSVTGAVDMRGYPELRRARAAANFVQTYSGIDARNVNLDQDWDTIAPVAISGVPLKMAMDQQWYRSYGWGTSYTMNTFGADGSITQIEQKMDSGTYVRNVKDTFTTFLATTVGGQGAFLANLQTGTDSVYHSKFDTIGTEARELFGLVARADGHGAKVYKVYYNVMFNSTWTDPTDSSITGNWNYQRWYDDWNIPNEFDPHANAHWHRSAMAELAGYSEPSQYKAWWDSATESERVLKATELTRAYCRLGDSDCVHTTYFGINYWTPLRGAVNLALRQPELSPIVDQYSIVLPTATQVATHLAAGTGEITHGLTSTFTLPHLSRTYTFSGTVVNEVQGGVTTVLSVLTKNETADGTVFLCVAALPTAELLSTSLDVLGGGAKKLVALHLNAAADALRVFEHVYDVEVKADKTIADLVTEYAAALDMTHTDRVAYLTEEAGTTVSATATAGSGVYSVAFGGVTADNQSISMDLGDTLSYFVIATGHPLQIEEQVSGSWVAITDDRVSYTYQNQPSSVPSDDGGATFKPTATGTYRYICTNHASMVGDIVVGSPTAAKLAAATIGDKVHLDTVARGHYQGLYNLVAA